MVKVCAHIIQKVIMAHHGAAALHPSGCSSHGNYLSKTGMVCSTSLLHVGIFPRSRNTKLEQFQQVGAVGSQHRADPCWGEGMVRSCRVPPQGKLSFQQPPFASSSSSSFPRVPSKGKSPFSGRIITKTFCLTKACWFDSLLLFFFLKAEIKSHFWPASSCSSVAQPRQSAQGKISLAGAPKSPMTTAEDNFLWKNTSELKVLHLCSLLEG